MVQVGSSVADAGTSSRTRLLLPTLVTAACFVAFLLAAIAHVKAERYFYSWDNFAYNRAALESLSALENPDASWWLHLRVSMQSGFSQLFTVTIAPLMLWLGEERTVFIGGLVGFYLLPAGLLSTLLVHRLVPLRPWEWPQVFAACACLPVYWRATLSGYPDIGGLVIALAAVLLVSTDLAYRRWSTAVMMGGLLAAVFLFRRHLAYCILPLMAVVSVSAVFVAWSTGAEARAKLIGGAVARLALSTLVALGAISAVAPDYFRELVGTNFRELYLPYQFPLAEAWRRHCGYIGIAHGLAGLAGLAWVAVRPGTGGVTARILIAYGLVSLGIWVGYLRYLGVQYNLHFAVVVGIGLGALAVRANRAVNRAWPSAVICLVLLAGWIDRLGFRDLAPAAWEAVLPTRTPPTVSPDYDTLRSLIERLRELAPPDRNRVLVAASSAALNSDMLTIGEGRLYGRNQRRLAIMNGSHIDTVQPYPLRDMLTADWIVVATPFQHHLRPDGQGVVLATHELMTTGSGFRNDFRQVDLGLSLNGGVDLILFERIAPTGRGTQVAAARHIFDTVGMDDAWNGPFMMGGVATGAEYYDVRLIVPTSPGRYLLDLSQVRLAAGQSSITVFVRTSAEGYRHLRGDITGGGVTVTAELVPDDEARGAVALESRHYPAGADIDVIFPGNARGILVVELTPDALPPAGSPLGLRIDNLRISGN